MINNHNYDLVKALTKKADALTVYDQYLKDSEGCQQCQNIWKKLKDEDSKHVDELKQLSSSHLS